MPDILNLGCGNRLVPGATNHDLARHRPEISVTHDLNVTPWPWPGNSFDEVQAVSVFEHLAITLVEAMDECWRILRPNGQLVVKYPLWSTPTAHDDPTHRWYWSERVLEVFDPERKYGKDHPYYTARKWQILDIGVIKGRNVKARMRPRK